MHNLDTRGRSRKNGDQFPKQQAPKAQASKGVWGHAKQEN